MAVNKASKSYIRRKGDAAKAISEVTKNLQSAIDELKITSKESLDEIALTILNTSNNYAPLDTGELRDSSYTESEETNNSYTVEIGYGNEGKAPYAVYVHEIGPIENPTTPGTTYKFLQRAVTETEADIERILADALRNTLK